MPYLFDSDWLIKFLASPDAAPALAERFLQEEPSISVITYLEVYQGAAYGETPDVSIRRLEELVASSRLLVITPEIARRCAYLRHHLAKQGKRVRPRAFDLLIASTALEHDLTLVTNNTKDYADIPRLRIYRESPASP
jgi:predicted nucleic acid-binding protein